MMSHDWGDAWSARHAQALLAYYSGDWLAAAREFESLALAAPQPGYYRYMAQRVARDIRPAGWTGVVTYGSELAYAYSTVIELDSERTDPHFARV
jgi:hypothetical protein